MSLLTERVDRALALSMGLHREQIRKGTEVPYVSHLWGVASLVSEMGGDEEEVIAALLHDAVEDQGGAPTLERIRQEFGERCAEIVAGCTDTDETPKPPWRARKEAYLAHLESANNSVLKVGLADKIHNARSLVRELRVKGLAAFDVFKGGKSGTLWYYDRLVEIFSRRGPGSPWSDMLAELVEELHRRSEV